MPYLRDLGRSGEWGGSFRPEPYSTRKHGLLEARKPQNPEGRTIKPKSNAHSFKVWIDTKPEVFTPKALSIDPETLQTHTPNSFHALVERPS